VDGNANRALVRPDLQEESFVMRQLLGPLAAAMLLAMPACAQSPSTTPAPDSALIEDLVAANRILYDQGVVDGFGHVSARSEQDPSHFLLARSMAPGLVEPEDILEFDFAGNAIDAQGRALYLERFIHSEIYKTHPEIKAIVHSHSPAVIPFGVTGVALKPIYHMSSFLGAGAPTFEIRDAGGDGTDMLVRNGALGAALAAKLGTSSVVLMRGHGDVVVGASVHQVVFRAVYTEVNARLESDALRLGNGQVIFLNSKEAAASGATNAALVDRAWDLWKAKAMDGRD
jgi:HCOMODA/2-hydroxy-3-carboxy-muconic semialdehyde decarboxylase